MLDRQARSMFTTPKRANLAEGSRAYPNELGSQLTDHERSILEISSLVNHDKVADSISDDERYRFNHLAAMRRQK